MTEPALTLGIIQTVTSYWAAHLIIGRFLVWKQSVQFSFVQQFVTVGYSYNAMNKQIIEGHALGKVFTDKPVPGYNLF